MNEARPSWLEVLERIDESLRQSMENLHDLPQPTEQVKPRSQEHLEKLLQSWEARLLKAEDVAGQTEQCLAEQQDAAEQYHARLVRLRETLTALVHDERGAAPSPPH